MDPRAPTPPAVRHPFWAVWSNPIFLRYCRSRLRPGATGLWLLSTLVIAGFFVALSSAIGVRSDLSPEAAARGPIIPLLFLQGFILFVLGTTQASGGMTAERDEGVMDYQRLIPMTPPAKVVGYLFGLPAREYAMFLATMPFMIWCLWKGEVSWRVWLPLYTVFFSTAVLYHLTGLLTGTVVRNRRWAFLASIGLVFSLYTVIPQLANFGLMLFKYLTLTPVFRECLPGLLPEEAAMALHYSLGFSAQVMFFDLEFSQFSFTLIAQGGLILVFVVMLCRKWHRYESHLLGKLWALGFFCWIQVVFLGNALPLVENGELFPFRQISREMGQMRLPLPPQHAEAVMLVGAYGGVTLALLLLFSNMITPTPDRQAQGWHRARKLGWKRIPRLADAASGWGFSLALALAGGIAWCLFTVRLVESRWFDSHTVSFPVQVCFGSMLCAVTLTWQALMELRGGRAVVVAGILVGAVPLMAGLLMSIVSEALYVPAIWVAGLSPLALPVYAGSLLNLVELPGEIGGAVSQAFVFWLAVFALTAALLTFRLNARRRTLARATPSVD